MRRPSPLEEKKLLVSCGIDGTGNSHEFVPSLESDEYEELAVGGRLAPLPLNVDDALFRAIPILERRFRGVDRLRVSESNGALEVGIGGGAPKLRGLMEGFCEAMGCFDFCGLVCFVRRGKMS